MPCYSTITKTKMTDENRLVSALKSMDMEVTSLEKDKIVTSIGTFVRDKSGNFAYLGTDNIVNVCRKYGELTAKAWQQKNGYGVLQNTGRKLILQKN